MAGRVMLEATGGPLAGTCYRFDTRMLCIIGRADNCMIQLLGRDGEGVSRHHCLLDLDPPHAAIQDLGSSNGTFLNGRDIRMDGGAENGRHPVCPLADGDTIRIVDHVFRIRLIRPRLCAVCGKPRDNGADGEWGQNGVSEGKDQICPDCAAGRKHAVFPSAKTIRVRTCIVCGSEITLPPDSDDTDRAGFICADCRLRNPDPDATFRIPDPGERASSLFDIPGCRILRKLGRGGMGDVYLGQDPETLEKVAVKVLRPDVAFFEACRDDFLREAENLMPLKHPNIVRLKGCRGDSGSIYLILEYCDKGTIRDRIRKNGRPFDIQSAVDLTFQILDALEYAHNVRLVQKSILDGEEYVTNGLVHRDIKPENIFLCEKEGVLTAKISDFGLSKAFELAGITDCTRTGDFSGTPAFVPKQQFLNYKYARPEVDVWAAAAVLFYMLTGLPPRNIQDSEEPGDIFSKKPRRIRSVREQIPLPLAKVLDAALDDTADLKFKTATAFRYALQDAVRKCAP